MGQYQDAAKMLEALGALDVAQTLKLVQKHGGKKDWVDPAVMADGEAFGSISAHSGSREVVERITESEGLRVVTETVEDSEGENGEDLVVYSYSAGFSHLGRERYFLVRSEEDAFCVETVNMGEFR